MAIDPIQGLIDYVNEVKPYHTKILEVAVAYAQNETVGVGTDVAIDEQLQLTVHLLYPGSINSDDDNVPIRICEPGYGVLFDRQTPYIIVDANASPQTISLGGDQTHAFVAGEIIEVREPYTDDAIASPQIASTPRVAIMYVNSVSYDSTTDCTVVEVRVISEDWLGSPIHWIGSPLTIPNGSPPFGGNEFWFPPYPDGSISGGDVFAIYDVVATNTLRIVTRPNVYYGSPIVGTGSPYTPVWPSSAGSPLPGSPKIVLGSPATYPNFGSPTPSTGNTIVLKSTTPGVFLYGQAVEIRNATEDTINKTYNILDARDLGGSPNLVELTVLDAVLTDTTNDGELVFAPDGFSGSDLCGDVPPEFLQTHWLENFEMTWRFNTDQAQQTDTFLPVMKEESISAGNHSLTTTVSPSATADAEYLQDASIRIVYPILSLPSSGVGSPATTSRTGKFYGEMEVIAEQFSADILFGRNDYIRADLSIFQITSLSPGGNMCVTYRGDAGSIWSNLVEDTAPNGITTGDIVNFAVDWDNEKVWFGLNGVWQGTGTQDPATNQGGYWPTDFTTTSGDIPARPHLNIGARLRSGTPDAEYGWRFSEDFWSYTPPTGFTVWDSVNSEPDTAAAGSFEWFGDSADYAIDTYGSRPFAGILSFTTSSSAYYNQPHATGRYYAEIKNLQVASSLRVGIISAAGSPVPGNAIPGTLVDSIAATGDGNVQVNSIIQNTTDLWTQISDGRTVDLIGNGETMMIAVDFDAGLFYYGANGIWSTESDPTAGSPSGGFSLPATGDFFLAAAAGSGASFLNAGGVEFTYEPPDGYIAWSSVSGEEIIPTEGLVPAFQEFIIRADAANNTVTVAGDARYIVNEFGSPGGGSPINVLGTIQHSVTGFGSPYDTTLNSNNIDVIISDASYDFGNNETTLHLDTVSESTPSGWIISR